MLFDQSGLMIEHNKSEVFHFSRITKNFNPSLLDLSLLSGPILASKDIWHYLGLMFNRKLLFHHYIQFYSNKSISMIKEMKMLENSTRGLFSHHK